MHPSRSTICEGQAGYSTQAFLRLDILKERPIHTRGNLAIWTGRAGPLVAFFCSSKAPASILLAAHDLAQQWRRSDVTVIGGFHSPVEQEVLTVLLRGPAPLIICPARSLHTMRLKPAWREAMEAGRLLLMSAFPDHVRRATRETAATRNRFVAALADAVVIGHAEAGSRTEALAEEALGQRKPVFTIAHQANNNLVALGADPLNPEQPLQDLMNLSGREL